MSQGIDTIQIDPSCQAAGSMATVKKPWVAFKVLAAGSIPTKVGFSYAFRNGADFIIVGMFDFQVADNVALAAQVVARNLTRKGRPWLA